MIENKSAAIMAEITKAVIGKNDIVEKILMAVLAGGLIFAAAQFLQVLVTGYHCLTGVLVRTVDADGIIFVQQGLAVCCGQLCGYL